MIALEIDDMVNVTMNLSVVFKIKSNTVSNARQPLIIPALSTI